MKFFGWLIVIGALVATLLYLKHECIIFCDDKVDETVKDNTMATITPQELALFVDSSDDFIAGYMINKKISKTIDYYHRTRDTYCYVDDGCIVVEQSIPHSLDFVFHSETNYRNYIQKIIDVSDTAKFTAGNSSYNGFIIGNCGIIKYGYLKDNDGWTLACFSITKNKYFSVKNESTNSKHETVNESEDNISDCFQSIAGTNFISTNEADYLKFNDYNTIKRIEFSGMAEGMEVHGRVYFEDNEIKFENTNFAGEWKLENNCTKIICKRFGKETTFKLTTKELPEVNEENTTKDDNPFLPKYNKENKNKEDSDEKNPFLPKRKPKKPPTTIFALN